MLPTLLKLIVQVLLANASEGAKSSGQWVELLKVVISALGPITAAVIASIAGAWIAHRYAAQRAAAEQAAINTRHQNEIQAENTRHQNEIEAENTRHQNELAAIEARHEKDLKALEKRYELDRESAWRSHAVELSKLEMQRNLEERKDKPADQRQPVWPATMHFLAVYRDLVELNYTKPGDLWLKIYNQRIARPRPVNQAANTAHEAGASVPANTENQGSTGGQKPPPAPAEDNLPTGGRAKTDAEQSHDVVKAGEAGQGDQGGTS